MVAFNISETRESKKQRPQIKVLLFYAFYGLVYIVFLPLRIISLIISKKYNLVGNSPWTTWFSISGHDIERKIIADTAFDGFIKFYQLRTSHEDFNQKLTGRLFGDFYCDTDYGLFLQELKNPGSWPKTQLIFIDKLDYDTQLIKKIRNSCPKWRSEVLEDHVNIIIEQSDTHIRKLEITPILRPAIKDE